MSEAEDAFKRGKEAMNNKSFFLFSDPNYPVAANELFRAGQLFMNARQFDNAIEAFNLSANANSKIPDVYQEGKSYEQMANCYAQMKRFEDAANYYERAVEYVGLSGKVEITFRLLQKAGEMFYELGKEVRGRQLFDKCIEMMKADGHYELEKVIQKAADLLMERKKLTDALPYIKDLISMTLAKNNADPMLPIRFLTAVVLHIAVADLSGAGKVVDQSMQANPRVVSSRECGVAMELVESLKARNIDKFKETLLKNRAVLQNMPVVVARIAFSDLAAINSNSFFLGNIEATRKNNSNSLKYEDPMEMLNNSSRSQREEALFAHEQAAAVPQNDLDDFL